METSPHTARTRAIYDRVGYLYDRQTAVFNEQVAYPYLLAQLRQAALPRGATVLDIGCGSGRLLTLLERAGYTARGVDLSPASVLQAQLRGTSAHEGCMTQLTMPTASCDAVVSYHAFNYLPHDLHHQALAEQARVLRPGGYAVLMAFYTPEQRTTPLEVRQLGETFTLYVRTVAELRDLYRDAGFSVHHSSTPICTTQDLQLVPEVLRPLLHERPYAQCIGAMRL